MTYQEALAFWFGRINYETKSATAYDLKLERMRALLRALGDPQDRLRIVHITGTKGKGSVSAMLESILQAAGYRVGLFTSPHLVHVEERFQVNRVPILPEEFAVRMAEVATAAQRIDPQGIYPASTFFEISTALGFLHFWGRRVDLAILEVGLGGRFDSTNVCRPMLTGITSVGYDHMAQLGCTLAEIAYQKAGILKPRIPCISGVQSAEAAAVIRRVAREVAAPLVELGSPQLKKAEDPQGFSVTTKQFHYAGLKLNLLGRHQRHNATIVLGLVAALQEQGLHIPESAVRQGLQTVVWPARVECLSRAPVTVLLDAAHNVPSIEALLETIEADFPRARHQPRRFLFAVSSDKQYPEMLARLAPAADELILTTYTNNTRRVPTAKLAATLKEVAPGACFQEIEDPRQAWATVWATTPPGGMIVVCGSVFLAGELRDLMLQDLSSSGGIDHLGRHV
jgi:dihydrofolate synthase/folylpolyglutamate synthase